MARHARGRALQRFLYASVLFVAAGAAAVALHTAFTEGDTMFSGNRPANLGLQDGRLAPCRKSPNCVSSQTDPADALHYVKPLALNGGAAETMAALERIVRGMARTRIVRREPGYLYAEFTSKLMGFVDDVEFALDEAGGQVHVRSASRLGRRDFGVNRERVEAIRARLGPA